MCMRYASGTFSARQTCQTILRYNSIIRFLLFSLINIGSTSDVSIKIFFSQLLQHQHRYQYALWSHVYGSLRRMSTLDSISDVFQGKNGTRALKIEYHWSTLELRAPPEYRRKTPTCTSCILGCHRNCHRYQISITFVIIICNRRAKSHQQRTNERKIKVENENI